MQLYSIFPWAAYCAWGEHLKTVMSALALWLREMTVSTSGQGPYFHIWNVPGTASNSREVQTWEMSSFPHSTAACKHELLVIWREALNILTPPELLDKANDLKHLRAVLSVGHASCTALHCTSLTPPVLSSLCCYSRFPNNFVQGRRKTVTKPPSSCFHSFLSLLHLMCWMVASKVHHKHITQIYLM